MKELFFKNYESAMRYAWDSKLYFKDESVISDIGETSAINIYNDFYQVIERLYYDESLYQYASNFDRN